MSSTHSIGAVVACCFPGAVCAHLNKLNLRHAASTFGLCTTFGLGAHAALTLDNDFEYSSQHAPLP